jgi:hypothetical protein
VAISPLVDRLLDWYGSGWLISASLAAVGIVLALLLMVRAKH